MPRDEGGGEKRKERGMNEVVKVTRGGGGFFFLSLSYKRGLQVRSCGEYGDVKKLFVVCNFKLYRGVLEKL